jgi:hypothetical protein
VGEPFKFEIDAERTLPEMAQMLLQIRASVDALAVLTIEVLTLISQADPIDVAKRYEAMQADYVLKHAFDLQENASPSKQQGEAVLQEIDSRL